MSDSQIIRAFVGKLIEKLGGFDATAALLTARFGKEVHKGTISKRQAGDLEWPLSHLWAMEDAAADHCISRYRMQTLPEVGEGVTLLRGLAAMARENGEAVEAVADLVAGRGCRDRARKEVSDVISAGKKVAAILDREDVAP